MALEPTSNSQLVLPKASIGEQIRTFTQKLSSQQKIIILSVAIAVVIGLAFLLFSSSGKNYEILFAGLDQKDVGLIVEKLKERKIDYTLHGDGTTIMVPPDAVYETRLSLAQEGIPKTTNVVGYELFDNTNLGMSEFVQKLNFRRALEGELQRTISSLEEVSRARVHLVIPEKTLFEADKKDPTASVTLHLKSGRSLSKVNVEGIQTLIASSVEGMQPSAVSVLDHLGKKLSEEAKDPNSLAGKSSTQYEMQQKVDAYYTQKAQAMLDKVLGVGNAEVSVTAELDFTQVDKTIEEYDPEKQIARSEQAIAEKAQAEDSLNFPTTNSQSERSNSITNYEIARTFERIVGSTGSIKRLSISALVNGTSKVEEEPEPKIVYTPRTNEEMQKITDVLKNTVGFNPGRNDQISVQNLQFDNTQLQEEIKSKGLELPLTIEEILEKVLMIAAMILAVLVLRRIFASRQIKKGIENILAPSSADLERQFAMMEAAEEQKMLMGGTLLTMAGVEGEASPAGRRQRLPNKEELTARARMKLEEAEAGVITEEVLLQREMKTRVGNYLENQTTDAIRLIKLLLAQENEDRRR